jgi:hypothetical protein
MAPPAISSSSRSLPTLSERHFFSCSVLLSLAADFRCGDYMVLALGPADAFILHHESQENAKNVKGSSATATCWRRLLGSASTAVVVAI